MSCCCVCSCCCKSCCRSCCCPCRCSPCCCWSVRKKGVCCFLVTSEWRETTYSLTLLFSHSFSLSKKKNQFFINSSSSFPLRCPILLDTESCSCSSNNMTVRMRIDPNDWKDALNTSIVLVDMHLTAVTKWEKSVDQNATVEMAKGTTWEAATTTAAARTTSAAATNHN